MKLVPVILSGGAGTRLWPVSRKAHPKPFMKLADGQSLAEKTIRRALPLASGGEILTVTSRDYYFLTRDVNYEIDSDHSRFMFLLEPFGRNTAPAIAMAALALQHKFGDDVLMLVMPADHLVENEAAFSAAVHDAMALAGKGYLVTFGVYPTHAETGYGYIRSGAAIDGSSGNEVAAFVEKPDLATAKEYFACGEYQWNSGMFCFRTSSILEALKQHAPEVYSSATNCFDSMDLDTDPLEIPPESFTDCPSISIDYAVMEQASGCAVVAGDFGWSDIGSWKSISELYETDATGNHIRGKAVLIEAENCYVQSEDRLVAAVGVNDLVIVDTGDAVLVAHRDRSQEVKQVVDHLTLHDHEAAIFHKTVHRPWGSFTILEDADDCKVKRLVVKPGQVLSLQSHQRRAEHWTVVSGVAKVRVGDEEFLLNANESTYIPVKTLHRLENPGAEDVHLIEVQTGDYFGEDDIERFEDIYGRS